MESSDDRLLACEGDHIVRLNPAKWTWMEQRRARSIDTWGFRVPQSLPYLGQVLAGGRV